MIERFKELDPLPQAESAREVDMQSPHIVHLEKGAPSDATIVGELSTFSTSFRWDIRRRNDDFELHASNSGTAFLGFPTPDRQVAIGAAELHSICELLADTSCSRWYPDHDVGGFDGTVYAFDVRSGLSFVSWSWWEEGPRDWRELIAAVRRVMERFKQLDPVAQAIAQARATPETDTWSPDVHADEEAMRTSLAREREHELARRIEIEECEKQNAAGVSCPHCGRAEVRFIARNAARGPHWICNACGRSFRVDDLRLSK